MLWCVFFLGGFGMNFQITSALMATDEFAKGGFMVHRPGHFTDGAVKLREAHGRIHFAGSGLAIASRYPIVVTDMLAYGTQACAGIEGHVIAGDEERSLQIVCTECVEDVLGAFAEVSAGEDQRQAVEQQVDRARRLRRLRRCLASSSPRDFPAMASASDPGRGGSWPTFTRWRSRLTEFASARTITS